MPDTPTINTCPASDCWRLVHDGTNVIALFHSTGKTSTINNLFTGTQDECNAQITALGLTVPPTIALQQAQAQVQTAQANVATYMAQLKAGTLKPGGIAAAMD